MALLGTKPDFSAISNAILGHFNSGDDLESCIAAAPASYFDESYKGNKDSIASFGKYGYPEGSVSVQSLSWAYNETDTKTFVVNTNKSRWHFSSQCSYEDFTVTVWDEFNSEQITNGIFTSGMVVRVTPIENNGGETNKYCYIYIATDPDAIMEGCEVIGAQTYMGYGTPTLR